jgi:anti-anti-sigma factor
VSQLARVTVARDSRVPVATLSGEIDISNAEDIESSLYAAVPNSALGVVLDMSELRYLDSAGVRMLFALDERLSRRGQQLHLAAPAEALVLRVLTMTGLTGSVPVHASVDEALAAFEAG